MIVVGTYATSPNSAKRKITENTFPSIETRCKSSYQAVVKDITAHYMKVTYFLINPNLMKLGLA
jgi:hypothetical protein